MTVLLCSTVFTTRLCPHCNRPSAVMVGSAFGARTKAMVRQRIANMTLPKITPTLRRCPVLTLSCGRCCAALSTISGCGNAKTWMSRRTGTGSRVSTTLPSSSEVAGLRAKQGQGGAEGWCEGCVRAVEYLVESQQIYLVGVERSSLSSEGT